MISPNICSSITTLPATFFICSAVILPGLNMCGTLSITLTTVDSNPISVSPPSSIQSTLSFNSLNISSTFVPLGLPDILALGAAIGVFANSISFLAIKLLGILIPTVFNPPVTILGTISFLSNTIVNGPGQNSSIRFLSIFEMFVAIV
ncbi:hypothetical protein D3C72_1588060 [compost metagenome]